MSHFDMSRAADSALLGALLVTAFGGVNTVRAQARALFHTLAASRQPTAPEDARCLFLMTKSAQAYSAVCCCERAMGATL